MLISNWKKIKKDYNINDNFNKNNLGNNNISISRKVIEENKNNISRKINNNKYLNERNNIYQKEIKKIKGIKKLYKNKNDIFNIKKSILYFQEYNKNDCKKNILKIKRNNNKCEDNFNKTEKFKNSDNKNKNIIEQIPTIRNKNNSKRRKHNNDDIIKLI